MATVGMLALMFVGFTIISQILQGAFIAASDVAVINNIVIFRSMSVFGWFTIPIPNFSFVTDGLPRLLDFDNYTTIFSGNGMLIAYILYALSAFIAFVLFMAIIGVVAGRIGRT
jgi:hypothetical protein